MAENIVTGIDSLLSYVNEKGEVDAQTLANALNVSQTTVIDWAKALEKAKLVRLVYKVGKMYISPTSEKVNLIKNPSDSKGSTQVDQANIEQMSNENVKKLSEIKSNIINQNLNIQRKNIDALNNKIKVFKDYFENTNKYLKESTPVIKSETDELVAYNGEAQKKVMNIKSYLDQINNEIQNLKSRDFDFNKEYLSFQNVDVVSKNAREIIDDLRSKTAYMRSSVKDLINEFNKKMFDMKDQFSIIEKELKEKDEQISLYEKTIYSQISNYDEKLEEYKKNQTEVNMKIKKERVAILDKLTKTKEDIEKIYNLSSKRYEKIASDVNKELEIIKQYQTKLDEIKKVDNQIKDIFKEVGDVKKEIIDLQSELKKGTTNKKDKVMVDDYKQVLVNEQKTKDIGDKIKDIEGKLPQIGAENEDEKPIQ